MHKNPSGSKNSNIGRWKEHIREFCWETGRAAKAFSEAPTKLESPVLLGSAIPLEGSRSNRVDSEARTPTRAEICILFIFKYKIFSSIIVSLVSGGSNARHYFISTCFISTSFEESRFGWGKELDGAFARCLTSSNSLFLVIATAALIKMLNFQYFGPLEKRNMYLLPRKDSASFLLKKKSSRYVEVCESP